VGKDLSGAWAFCRVPVPTPFRQFPDRWGQSKHFSGGRLGWPSAPHHRENDYWIRTVGERNISGVQLTTRHGREHLGRWGGRTPTSMMTIDSAYTSDLVVGIGFLLLSVSALRSSGADQRSVPPLWGVEALTEVVFFVIEKSPKSARRGLPFSSIRMLGYGKVRRVSICDGDEGSQTLCLRLSSLRG